jgi:hypothetical protein
MGYGNRYDCNSYQNPLSCPVSDDWSMGLGSQFGSSISNLVDESLRIGGYTSNPWASADDRDELSLRDLECNWPQCSSVPKFNSVEEQKIHIKHHAQEVTSNWSPGRRCTWHKCSSKALHKSRSLFEAHINNIHVNPLVCTVKDCKHKAPFRANHDLRRHIATAHYVDAKYNCPFKFCAIRCRCFRRKDKWLSHLKEHHETEVCPYAHCWYGQDDISLHRKSASKHIGKAHSFFECALKSCEGKTSCFSATQLLEHLEIHHGMEWALVLKTRDSMVASGGLIIKSEHLLQDMNVRDCKVCMK